MERAAIWSATVCVALVCACTCTERGSRTPDAGASAARRDAEPGGDGGGVDPSLPATKEIGFAVLAKRAPFPGSAGRANQDALEAHERGDYAASRAGFEKALELFPRYDVARFNLACALSRLGRHEEALPHLEIVLRRDLPQFLPKVRADEDLAGLRSSAAGKALEERVGALEKQWEAAIGKGMPAAYLGRYGVYLPESERFVPVIPPSGIGGAYGMIDTARRRVALVATEDIDSGGPDQATLVKAVAVVPFTPPGGAAETAKGPREQSSSFDYWDFPESVDVSREKVAFYFDQSWWVLSGGGLTRVEGESRTKAPERPDRVPPEGLELRGNDLVVPGGADPIRLGSGHAVSAFHSYGRSDDGRYVVVASTRFLDAEQVGFEDYVRPRRAFIDHVDLETRGVTRLWEGRGDGVVLRAAGDAYVVLGQKCRVYRGFRADEHEDLPMGLLPLPPQPSDAR